MSYRSPYPMVPCTDLLSIPALPFLHLTVNDRTGPAAVKMLSGLLVSCWSVRDGSPFHPSVLQVGDEATFSESMWLSGRDGGRGGAVLQITQLTEQFRI